MTNPDFDDSDRFIEGPPEARRRINLVPEPSREQLNPRQYRSYRSHRRAFVEWMLEMGKEPDEWEGYAYSTTYTRAKYHDLFCRWVWQYETGGYTTTYTHDYADSYMVFLKKKQREAKRKRSGTYKTLKNYFQYLDDTDKWDPDGEKRPSSGGDARIHPREYLKVQERTALEEASLEYGTVPHYNSVTPEERDELKHVLAERFRKPKESIGPRDFERANSFKIPSLIHAALDAGLRPIEVGKLRTQWIDLDNRALTIPADESAKNRNNWTVALRSQTTDFLDQWLGERAALEKYDDSDRVWLTREGNPYGTRTCNYLFRKLCDQASIDHERRDLSWYAIRHSTGSYMADKKGLKAAASQLRHNSLDTTQRYNHTSLKELREGLEDI